jgi:hypothetical protein
MKPDFSLNEKPAFGSWLRTCVNREDEIGKLARLAPPKATRGGLYVLTDWIEESFQREESVTPTMLELIRVAYDASDEWGRL